MGHKEPPSFSNCSIDDHESFDLGALENTDDDGRQHSQIHFLV